ncbi:hypothetical protein ECE50_004295 [Chitinophaga sp. Mgbs1]|uniref:Uncharacterized protein n=1 Tax=Chitinophaga solisilvae TaxID=1233460 RepID=A0A3S1D5P9_9BACT|nr:hypothetical protein [Chitinophaga solisilvae]
MNTTPIPMQTDNYPPLLLTFDVSSDPSPLTDDISGKVIMKLQPDTTVSCLTITIMVPQGDDTDDIYKINPEATLSVSNTDWSVGNAVNIHNDATGIDYRQWPLSNTVGGMVSRETDFTVTGIVNDVGGSPDILIQDYSASTSDYQYALRQNSYQVPKNSTPPFYLRSLFAIDPQSSQYPCGAIHQGYAVEIAWDGYGGSYQLYQSGIADPVYSGTGTNYTLPNGITDTTTFCCVATNTNGDKLFASFTLIVIDPALTPQSVTTHKDEHVHGTLNSNSATCNSLNLASNAITMTGTDPGTDNLTNDSSSLNLSGNFSVDTATFSNVTTSGLVVQQDFNGTYPEINIPAKLSLQQPDITTLNTTDISVDDLTIQGSLTFTGQQAPMFGDFVPVASGTSIQQASRKANTDGYVIITVDLHAQNNDSIAYGGISYDGDKWFYAYGGIALGLPIAQVYGFLWLPVPAGTTWYYKGDNTLNTPQPATINILWFPTGNDSGSGYEAAASIPVPAGKANGHDPVQVIEQYRAARKERRTELVNSIETLLDTTFDTAVKEDMIRQLMSL